jgi:hypothetical protein
MAPLPMVALTSFVAIFLLLLALLQTNASERLFNTLCCSKHMDHINTENAHNELLMGYDILNNVFTGQSKLWLVPILRRLSFGAPILQETSYMIQQLTDVGKKRKKELKQLRNMSPDVSRKFIDPNKPNKLVESIGKNAVWRIMQDLTTRGDEFDLHFGIVHMASARFVTSLALGMLNFEENAKRREWLQNVANEYTLLRTDVRDVILDYIHGEKQVFLRRKAIRFISDAWT